MSIHICQIGVERLRTAMLQDAVNKYTQALHYLTSHEQGVGSSMKQNRFCQMERQKNECEKFFLSTWFDELYEFDPVVLITTLRNRDNSKPISWDKVYAKTIKDK